MLEAPLDAYLLFGAEPWDDSQVAAARATLERARFVVSVTPFASDITRAVSHVILPAGTFAESSGSFVNLEGRWQSFAGAARPVGEARPGWKLLRVLGNQLGLAGFEYQSSEEVLAELRANLDTVAKLGYDSSYRYAPVAATESLTDVAMYRLDPLLRRATSLQLTRTGSQIAARYAGT
jgi:NADH-quinone oxidoreductase subunit G